MKLWLVEVAGGRSVAWERAGRPLAERRRGGREVSGRWCVVHGGSEVVSVGEDVVAGRAAGKTTGSGRREEIQVVV